MTRSLQVFQRHTNLGQHRLAIASPSLSTDGPNQFDQFQTDLSSELLRSRTVIVGPNLDEKNYNLVIARLVFLQEQDPSSDVALWINCDQPTELGALAICDLVRSFPTDVRTYCVGKAVGVSAVLLACGTKGKRIANRNASICLCQPSAKASGNATEVARLKRRIELTRDRTAGILAEITSRSKTEVLSAIDRELWMSADQARGYGLVDEVK